MCQSVSQSVSQSVCPRLNDRCTVKTPFFPSIFLITLIQFQKNLLHDSKHVLNERICFFFTGQRCSRFAVGISNAKEVIDDQFTASSSLGPENEAWHARIGGIEGDGWCAARGTINRQYLQVDLKKDYVFCGITVQGGFHGHVDGFELEFARKEGGPFTPYRRVRYGVEPF